MKLSKTIWIENMSIDTYKFEWIISFRLMFYAHQNPKQVINPSNSTICAKLQAQETKPLELQLLAENPHSLYPQATTLLERSMFFVLKGCWKSIYEAQTHKNTKFVGSRRMDVVFMV